jgi:predicted phage-related endonuclease
MVGKVTPDTMLSASRLPAVMGYSKYRSPNDELSASIDALGNKETQFVTNEAMEWGNTFETTILERAAGRLGVSNLITEHPEPYFHPLLKLACSLDATADGNGVIVQNNPDLGIMVMDGESIQLDGRGILEAKLTSVAPEHSPALYRGVIQLQAQMDITGAKWGALAVLYRGIELRIFLFKPHEESLRAITQATLDFQRRLDIWKMDRHIEYYPPVNSADADRTWGQGEDTAVQLGGEFETWVRDILEAKQDIKQCESIIDDREKRIKEAMQTASKATIGCYQVSWPMRNYQATQDRVVKGKAAYSVRQSTLTVKEIKQ